MKWKLRVVHKPHKYILWQTFINYMKLACFGVWMNCTYSIGVYIYLHKINISCCVLAIFFLPVSCIWMWLAVHRSSGWWEWSWEKVKKRTRPPSKQHFIRYAQNPLNSWNEVTIFKTHNYILHSVLCKRGSRILISIVYPLLFSDFRPVSDTPEMPFFSIHKPLVWWNFSTLSWCTYL